jgi:hypothetical protein
MAESLKNARAVFTIFSLVLIGVGAFKGAHVYLFESHAKRAQGLVLENQQEMSEGGRVAFNPIISFTDVMGHEIRVDKKLASSPVQRYSPGDNVEILYLQSDPKQSAIIGGIEPWRTAIQFVYWGVFLLLVQYAVRAGIISSNMYFFTNRIFPASILFGFVTKAYRSHIEKRNS